MKRKSPSMTNAKYISIMFWPFVIGLMLMAGAVQAQEEEGAPAKDTRPVRNTFESTWLIDNQTVMVPIQGTFQFDILHRFGTIKNGYDDLWGLYAPSNIRLGFTFVPVNKFQIGFGFTKERKMWDFNAKLAIFQQGRSGGSPVSMTYFVNAAVDTRDEKNFVENIDRYTYFHQLMVARKLSNRLSLQAALSVSHFNFVPQVLDPENPGFTTKMKNDHLAMAFLGRFKVSDALSIIANYDLPLTSHDITEPKGNLSFGIEAVSSSHAFQIFLGNYQSIVPQLNNARNQNSMDDGEFLIGFNITRLWNF